MKQFAPDKLVPGYRSELADEISISDADISPGSKKFKGPATANFSNTMHNSMNQELNFEERMIQREIDEKKGKLFPRETIMTLDGGKLQIKGHMSRKDYIDNYNSGITIGPKRL